MGRKIKDLAPAVKKPTKKKEKKKNSNKQKTISFQESDKDSSEYEKV